tara:strand:+ start:313 stop:831 length:519 start_codon:yes stop_codon:yes gene_type:complete
MRHWTTEHYPDAVPLDLWELIRALVTEAHKHLEPEDRITQEAILDYVKYLTQFGHTKLDAYRLYGGLDNLTITVGIRYGNEAPQYMSPHLSREIADQFDLDPLNRDKIEALSDHEINEEVAKYNDLRVPRGLCKSSHDIPSLHDALKNTVFWEDIVGPVKGYGKYTQEDEES